MGYVLRLLLPVAAFLAAVAAPAAGAGPRAQTAAEHHAEAALEEAADLREGRGVRTGRELTEALRELSLSVRHLRGDARAEAAALLARPAVPGPVACAGDFCVHGKPGGSLTAALILDEAQKVHDFETGTLGWRDPPDDGDGRVDIYLEDVGADLLFGYAQTTGTDTQSQPTFLVIDDDFSAEQFGPIPTLTSLRVTLAHEYGHVLQYGYDVTADGWHYESTAVWLEHRMYPELDDWLRFVNDGERGAGWAGLTEVPLTAYDDPRDQPRNAKPYGTAVWSHFLANRYGDAVQRRSWELSDGLSAPSTHAYDLAIRESSGPGLSRDFASFAAAVAEWELPGSGFPQAERLPEVERAGELAPGGRPVNPVMDHTTFALYDVAETSADRIALTASFPARTSAAVALVARDGATGEVTTRLTALRRGGTGRVVLEDAGAFFDGGGRVTAVLVNADASHYGFGLDDWAWAGDAQRVTAAVSTEGTPPQARLRVLSRADGELLFRLRSRDGERLSFLARLVQRGRTVARRAGRVGAFRSRFVTLRAARAGRGRLVVRLEDRQGNARRLERTLQLPR